MPRPGPRPYECVRRAWHSERHHPMRGLMIQQILRLVRDNHSAGTKKNREWQEKLPVVVLKAEEIMYSKANSEDEYSNSETIWSRINDAIDTIIRKDESTETGVLLPPCVEAALNLGCVPVRASRSQRHNNPRTYLRPPYQACSDEPRKVLQESTSEQNSELMPLQTSSSSKFKMPSNVDSPHLAWECNKHIMPNNNKPVASLCADLLPIGEDNSTEVMHNTSLNRVSVYPLYYETSLKMDICQLGFQEPQKTDYIIVGVPVFSSVGKAAEVGCIQDLSPCAEDKNGTKGTCETSVRENKGKAPQMGCDLSLRLGQFCDSYSSRQNGSNCGTDTFGYRVPQDEGLPKEKEFSFFPVESADDSSWLPKSRWNSEGENKNMEVVSRKRKLPFTAGVENKQFFWSHDPTIMLNK